MEKVAKVLMTGKTHTCVEGGGSNASRHDFKVNIALAAKGAPNHTFNGIVAHPTAEQLFAGAWSACYTGALGLVASKRELVLPDDLAVDIEVDLGQNGAAFVLQARMDVHLPGLAKDVAEKLAHEADQICPYSKAVRGNIEVVLKVVV